MTTTRRQFRKQERKTEVKMNRMQPSKRTGKVKNVKNWCLNKLNLLRDQKLLHYQDTLKRIYKFDELMYFRLRRMLDGA